MSEHRPENHESEDKSASNFLEDYPNHTNQLAQATTIPQWAENSQNDEEMEDLSHQQDPFDGEHLCEQSQFTGNFRWDRPLTDKCLEGISLPDWTQTMFKRRMAGEMPSTSEVEQHREIITAKRRRKSPEIQKFGNVERAEADSSVLDSELEVSGSGSGRDPGLSSASNVSPSTNVQFDSTQTGHRSHLFF